MTDELSLLRQIGSSEVEPAPEIEARVRRQVVDAIARERRVGRRARPRPTVRGTMVGLIAVAACAGVVAAVLSTGSSPSVAERAYAAIARPSGIMHFIAEYPSRQGSRYEEYWIDLAHPRRQRIVQTSGGRVTGQLVFVTHAVPYGGTGWRGNPVTSIIQAPKEMGTWTWGGYGGIRAGKDPMAAYRDLLRTGTVRSEREMTYRGRDAYELEVQFEPPYDFVDDVWTGERMTYIVDRSTYFPLESTFRTDPTMGEHVTVTRFPRFGIFPSSRQTRALLRPVEHPRAYHP